MLWTYSSLGQLTQSTRYTVHTHKQLTNDLHLSAHPMLTLLFVIATMYKSNTFVVINGYCSKHLLLSNDKPLALKALAIRYSLLR